MTTQDAPNNQLSSDDLLEAVVSNAPIVLFATDHEGRIVLSRGKALARLGLREGELVGRSVFELYKSEPHVAIAAREALAGRATTARLDLGGPIHETLFSPLIRDGEVQGIVGIATDVTEREQAAEQLRYLARHNAATGLANRGFFLETLEGALTEARQHTGALSLMVAVLTGFQEVSETFGYDVGTAMLAESGERLRGLTGDRETAGVLEAGKFAILTPTALRLAPALAERVAAELSRPFMIGPALPLSLSVSVGIAAFPGHATDAEPLIRAAEQASREAASRRTPVHVHQSTPADRGRNYTLLADLRAAIEESGLHLEYQPLVDVRTGELESVEALARWRHPRHGLIAPGEFVPIAERAGLLPRLTEFVMETAARQLYVWEQDGLRAHVAVNVSPEEVLSSALEDVVRPSFDTWGIGLDRLTLEVTEDQRLGDVGAGELLRLDALTGTGMGLAIDDFGTGYSNMGTLQRLPWSQLKVDRSFVEGLESGRTRQLVGAMIELGHSFERTVVAEGVETRAQWDVLAGLGCDLIQGYHVARPLAAEALPAVVQEASWRGS